VLQSRSQDAIASIATVLGAAGVRGVLAAGVFLLGAALSFAAARRVAARR
jgi:hypothetical protein